MDVSLLTLALDRLVPGSVAMTPAALKHAQSKHSRVGREGVIPQPVCSAPAVARPRSGRVCGCTGPPAPRSAPKTESLWHVGGATVSEESPQVTLWSFMSNELYLTDLAAVMRSHLPSSGGLHVPFFPSSPRDSFVPMISHLLLFTSQIIQCKLRAISAKAPGSCTTSQ